MKILNFDRKEGVIRILPERMEDLWHLEKVLEKGDIVSASTTRIVKFGTKEERKPVFITLSLEDFKFSKSGNRLRLHGKILSGKPEDFVQAGRYHTIDAEPGVKLSIKKHWKSFHLKRLRDAERESRKPLVLMILMDDEKAITAVLRSYGLEYGPEFFHRGSKKGEGYSKHTERFFNEILSYISDWVEKSKNPVVVAGPGFTKDNFKKFLKTRSPALLSRIVFDSCSYAEKPGFTELMNRGIITRISGEQRLEREHRAINKFISLLNKNSSLTAYGLKPVESAVSSGAVEVLMVLDSLLRTEPSIQKITEHSEKYGSKLLIFSSDAEPGMKLAGFGGIAAILRFPISEQ